MPINKSHVPKYISSVFFFFLLAISFLELFVPLFQSGLNAFHARVLLPLLSRAGVFLSWFPPHFARAHPLVAGSLGNNVLEVI